MLRSVSPHIGSGSAERMSVRKAKVTIPFGFPNISADCACKKRPGRHDGHRKIPRTAASLLPEGMPLRVRARAERIRRPAVRTATPEADTSRPARGSEAKSAAVKTESRPAYAMQDAVPTHEATTVDRVPDRSSARHAPPCGRLWPPSWRSCGRRGPPGARSGRPRRPPYASNRIRTRRRRAARRSYP